MCAPSLHGTHVTRPRPSYKASFRESFLQEFLTCFHASFFPFCPLCWPPLFLPFYRHLLALFFPLKSALFCRERGTAQSLESGSFRMDLSTRFGKEIPSRNLREKRSDFGGCLEVIKTKRARHKQKNVLVNSNLSTDILQSRIASNK